MSKINSNCENNLINPINKRVSVLTRPGKSASGASGACGHFVGNHSVLRTAWFKYPVLFTEVGKRRVEDEKLRLDKRDLR